METKICKQCGVEKDVDLYHKNRLTCKECVNLNAREKYKQNKEIMKSDANERSEKYRNKIRSDPEKHNEYKKRQNDLRKVRLENNRDKINKNRRERHHERMENDPEYNERYRAQRKKAMEKRSEKRRIKREEELERIGEGNKECRYCKKILPLNKFRHNRCRCKTCEKDHPYNKFIRNVRTRVYNGLHGNKNQRTIKYLGMSNKKYIEYITSVNPEYTLENHGSVWHIDHVIPLSRFKLLQTSPELQEIAFNWRNTTPICKIENLQKHNKIDKNQIQSHYEMLQRYHEINNIELPQEYIDLFATYLDAGTPLEL